MRVVELFAGIGAQHKALSNIGIDAEYVISEIDKHAIASYNAIHGETPNLGDITKIEILPECDILTYSWPCQDISQAGNQKGFKEGSETRSGLLWEVGRLLETSPRPKYLIAENVKAVTSTKFKNDLNKWIRTLSEMGYTSSWAILNAKDYRIPQNRERFFMVSCLDGTHFQFPKGRPLEICLKDILEEKVDERYYLTPEQIATYEAHKERHAAKGHVWGGEPTDGSGHASALKTEPTRNPNNFIQCVQHGSISQYNYEKFNRVYDPNGICPAIDTCEGGGRQVKIIDKIIAKNIVMQGKIRKYDVDKEKLSALLRTSKIKSEYTNSQIAKATGVPLTMVEHWFRSDSSFSIPDSEIWFCLKEILQIETTEFDTQLTEYELKEGTYEKSGRIYDKEGISPTLCSTGNVLINTIDIIDNTKKGYVTAEEGDSIILSQPTSNTKRARVQKSMASTLMTDGNGIGVITSIRPICYRALSPSESFYGPPVGEDGDPAPTCKVSGLPNGVEISVRPIYGPATQNGSKFQGPTCKGEGEPSYTLLAEGNIHGVELNNGEKLLIRKLTEREYWRLMGFSDDDFNRAATVSSRTQLYKQAGNSIVVSVLEAIFKELLTKKQPKVMLLSDYAEAVV